MPARTVLYTDVVASTEQVRRFGDEPWNELMARHEAASATAIRDHGGAVVKFTGDGVLAVFDHPGSALLCAPVIRSETERLGLQIRCGLATGPVVDRDRDIAGVTVHLAQRLQSCAAPGQILATLGTIQGPRGSVPAHRFAGNRHLKGFDDEISVVEIDPPPAHGGRTMTAIVIDDHPSFRRSVRALVESEGIAVLATAENGDEGVALARSLQPDLVLVDVQLPGMDGIEVAARLSELSERTTVILISAQDRSAYGDRIDSTVYVTKAELVGVSFTELVRSGQQR